MFVPLQNQSCDPKKATVVKFNRKWVLYVLDLLNTYEIDRRNKIWSNNFGFGPSKKNEFWAAPLYFALYGILYTVYILTLHTFYFGFVLSPYSSYYIYIYT